MKKLLCTILCSMLTLSAAVAQTSTPASITLPPDLERVLRDYEKAWSANDLAGLAKLFTSDGMALPSGQMPAQGDDSIRKAYAKGAGSPLSLRAFGHGGSGDMAYVLGGFSGGADKPEFGKFVLVLRRVEGRWLIVADMDNSNRPMRAPVPAAPTAPPAPAPKP